MDFSQIIEVLLFLENDEEKLRGAARNYYEFLSRITGIDDLSEKSEDKTETILENGKAISPIDAARCVLDFARTSKFLRGLFAAICEAKKRFPRQKIEILYAGCGPFAALAVPLCFKFRPDEISFTLIDIHRRSLVSAERIFQKLGLENFISEYIQTDAAAYRDESGKKFSVVVTETMQKALEKEPQAAITLNLAKLLCENGIFIPQKISVDAFLTDFQNEFSTDRSKPVSKQRIHLGKILELSAENLPDENSLSAIKTVKIPPEVENSNGLILATRVRVFGDFALEEYESGLTYPAFLSQLPETAAGRIIEFQYKSGSDPRFEHRLV